ncbi:hypothetical protein Poli38472_003536 [Pythium oligandrum]|uniref:Uncharacterized protein n=1 Tax=Pythium oligandrum TaxID=41045 RepID=A0A8K1C722_PYTOL|nr:hypothetical protein Poli38472_003536 [Pythium oligandrum]|eukprot:TMW57611.1 hypothetical protein Poli38472_003536 [Pythium oligandrum]
MVMKKNGKKPTTGAGEENNPLAGTLEDYFNSQKTYQSEQMKAMTKHLLTGSGANNAMIMEKDEADALIALSKGRVEDQADSQAKGAQEKSTDDQEPVKRTESKGESDSNGEYEDDYESDTPSADTSVAGMALDDYLQAQNDAGSKKPQDEAKAKTPAEKKSNLGGKKAPPPPALISGMSLDYYLGASSPSMTEDEARDGQPRIAESKTSPPKKKKTKTKSKAVLAPMRHITPENPNRALTSPREEYATPFQKRMKKKQALKQQQQQHQLHSSSVARSILLGDSHSSSQLLQAKPMTLSSSKKKASDDNSPLPKLLGASSSAHSFLPVSHHHRDAPSDDDYEDNDDDTSADEKLPPLQHNAGNK